MRDMDMKNLINKKLKRKKEKVWKVTYYVGVLCIRWREFAEFASSILQQSKIHFTFFFTFFIHFISFHFPFFFPLEKESMEVFEEWFPFWSVWNLFFFGVFVIHDTNVLKILDMYIFFLCKKCKLEFLLK